MRATIEKHMPNVDMGLIDQAVEYANAKHCYQKRKDGSPYIIHPLAVAVKQISPNPFSINLIICLTINSLSTERFIPLAKGIIQ